MSLEHSLTRILTKTFNSQSLSKFQVLNCLKSSNIFSRHGRYKILETINNNSPGPLQPYTYYYNGQHPKLADSVYPTNESYKINYLSSLKNVFQTTKLKLKYDQDFNTELFKKGTKQAMSVITKCLQENKKAKRYVNWPEYERLYQTSKMWSDAVRFNIALEPEQISQTLILKINDVKFSDSTVIKIDTISVANRKHETSDKHFVHILLRARFERIYNAMVKPEWNTTEFDVLKMIFFPIL